MQIRWQRWLDTLEEEYVIDENGNEQILVQRPTIITSMGILPDDFNFWLGHTDFRIYADHKRFIEDTNGVETLEVMTPYRFRISIGQCFDQTQVKLDIQKALGVPKKSHNDIEELKSQFKSAYWAIYRSPNGKIDSFESDDMDAVYKKIRLYEKTKDAVGGEIFYWSVGV